MLDNPTVFEAITFAIYVAEGVAEDQHHDHAGDEYAEYARILSELNLIVEQYAAGLDRAYTIRDFIDYLGAK
jgi:hypothetical protein